jgi:glycosyltransferase involved in cell wall biosynthesis
MQEEKNKDLRVLYLHGRPGAHPVHVAFAKAITSEFRFVDEPVRWQDQGRGIVFNLYAWFMNALRFKDRKKYDVFLVDNLHVTIPLMRMLGLLKKKQKTIVHLGSHTLYFMYSGKFSRINLWMHKLALRNYDALICEGKMAHEMARLILKEKCPPAYTTFLGPQSSRNQLLKTCEPELNSHNILIIAAGPEKFREFYKGLDIMFKSFQVAFTINPKLKLTILGDWKQEIKNDLLNQLSTEAKASVEFAGVKTGLESYLSYLKSSALCLHCSRGDAFPTSTIETMSAGLPTIVSEWTGTKEVVVKVDPRLIVPLDVNLIADKINWYFNLTEKEREELSAKGRKVTEAYNEEDAIKHYKETFKKICHDLKIQ